MKKETTRDPDNRNPRLHDREHMEALDASMRETQRLAAEVAAGGEAYPAGVRDVARQLADKIEAELATVGAISARAG